VTFKDERRIFLPTPVFTPSDDQNPIHAAKTTSSTIGNENGVAVFLETNLAEGRPNPIIHTSQALSGQRKSKKPTVSILESDILLSTTHSSASRCAKLLTVPALPHLEQISQQVRLPQSPGELINISIDVKT
jgi:hypothetical protein